MSNGTYTGTYSGVVLTTAHSNVTFTASALVVGDGGGAVTSGSASNAYTVSNAGTIENIGDASGFYSIGIGLYGGGMVVNAGTSPQTGSPLIEGGAGYGSQFGTGSKGGAGIFIASGAEAKGGTVSNSGTIAGGTGGGGAYGGGGGGNGVSIEGAGAVSNQGMAAGGGGGQVYGGSIDHYLYGGLGGTGVSITGGGTISNGGTIAGGGGGFGAAAYSSGGAGGAGVSIGGGGTISNQGLVAGGSGGVGQSHNGGGGAGIVLAGGGMVVNAGTSTETKSPLIEGGSGLGSQSGMGGNGGAGIVIGGGTATIRGTISNGGTIAGGSGGGGGGFGGYGVSIDGIGVVSNQGMIAGGHGGQVYGGSTNSALNGGNGGTGVSITDAGTVSNAGTITGGGGGFGAADFSSGGNGGAGVSIGGGGTILNQGVIAGGSEGGGEAGTGNYGVGIALSGGAGFVSNASTGLIGGSIGVYFSGNSAGTVVNAGTISGTSYAVRFGAASDVLIDKAGSTFTGKVLGGGGTLELAGPGGTIAGLGNQYSDFGRYQVLAGASWTITGSNVVTNPIDIAATGTLTNDGSVANASGTSATAIQLNGLGVLIDEAGSSIVGLVLGGGGSLDLTGGSTAAPGTISGLDIKFTGFANYSLAGAWMLTGSDTIRTGDNLHSTGAFIDDGTVTIAGTAVFSGPISGTGTLLLDGIESFHAQNTVAVADLVINGGTAATTAGFKDADILTLSGGNLALTGQSVTISGTAIVSGGTVVGSGGFDTSGVTDVTGGDFGGRSVWQNSGTVTETASVTFGNATGDGQLTNAAGGVFDITDNAGIDVTGDGGGVLNQGLFEKTGGTGDSLIEGSMNNAATMLVSSGTLHFVGEVQGKGTAVIDPAGELRFNAVVASMQTISFSGSGGELSLSESTPSSFAAGISGFGAGDRILIGAFAYFGDPQVHWTQQGSKGTLAITDNGATLNLILFGQYTAGTFAAGNSGGATLITYTPPQAVGGILHR